MGNPSVPGAAAHYNPEIVAIEDYGSAVGWLGFQADGSPVRTAPEYRDWVRAPGGMETDSDDRELPFDRRLGEFTLAILRQRHAPGELGNKHT